MSTSDAAGDAAAGERLRAGAKAEGAATLLGFQYLRALAATMIILEHAEHQLGRGPSPLGFRFWIGPAGVDMFLVVSGFVAYYATRKTNRSVVDFWVRRAIRVVPLYWLFTALFLGVYLVMPDALSGFAFEWAHALSSFLFIPTFHPIYSSFAWPALTPGWVLNYQMFFYLIFGGLLAAGASHRLGLNVAILVLLAGTGLVAAPTSAAGVVYTSPLLLEIVAGLLIGWWYFTERRVPLRIPIGLLVAGLSMFVLAGRHGEIVNDGNWLRLWAWGLPSVLLVAGVALVDRTGRTPRLPWLVALGDASYSTYLSHSFVLAVVARVWRLPVFDQSLPGIVQLACAIAASHVVGYAVWKWVEVPTTKTLTLAAANYRWTQGLRTIEPNAAAAPSPSAPTTHAASGTRE